MAVDILRHLQIAATQGGADAFVQGSVATDIIPENGLVYEVTSIAFQLATDLATQAADFSASWAITRDTKSTTVPNFGDSDVIFTDVWALALVTSGFVRIPHVFQWPVQGVYIVEPTIYAQFDTVGGGGAITAYIRMYYREVKMSEIDILRILNNT